MFNGFFKNIDYTEDIKEEFLKNGQQTLPNDKISNTANNIQGDNCSIIVINRILYWMENNLKHENNNSIKFTRTASQIINSGIYTGCSDFALLFESIAREKKIPTIHLQTVRKKFVEDIQNNIQTPTKGHHFCECYINNKWILVDPLGNKILKNYNNQDFNLGEYYIFSKSTDIFETGIRSIKENNNVIRDLSLGLDSKSFHRANADIEIIRE
ncbi:MAG: transglutaminase domain-containing protein [Clostridia bacterium]|nr:transglutaminase domain-containing protein [Clostridia bacterium]